MVKNVYSADGAGSPQGRPLDLQGGGGVLWAFFLRFFFSFPKIYVCENNFFLHHLLNKLFS